MGLREYQKKRILSTSGEPKPKQIKSQNHPLAFVVQKHAARRLHYDFRLECGGVLKSWAVPKGPSLDTHDKRLAIMVEDHPLEYGSFEGIIPKGHYGAGQVDIWDKGTYHAAKAQNDSEDERIIKQGIAKGELVISLNGEKLKGEFALVKLKKGDPDDKNWLLIKKQDRFASQGEHIIMKKDPPLKKMPHMIKPMLSTLTEKPFDNEDWLFEIKWDGYRAIAEINGTDVSLYSRNHQSFAERFPKIVKELKALDTQAILDGEIVILDEKGISHFQLLQDQDLSHQGSLCYCIFDLLYLNGKDLRNLPLIERKMMLKELLKNSSSNLLHFSDYIEANGVDFFEKASKNGLEGIIAKNKFSSYQQKRSRDWLKIKTSKRQEAIICGFTEPKGSRDNFGALVLGLFEKNHLEYIGDVGTGFDQKKLHQIYKLLKPLIQAKSPFQSPPKKMNGITWVKPKILCEVEFREWTHEGKMRQPVFLGIRTDKKPREVVLETPEQIPENQSNAKIILTHTDKVFWPNDNYTKGDLLEYYHTISPIILPHLRGRPEVLHRYPNGIKGNQFYQKEIGEKAPSYLTTALIKHDNKNTRYLIIDDETSLLFAVNMGCIELHPFLSRTTSLESPDFLVIDLDPEGVSFDKVIEIAQIVHEILDEAGAKSFCKTSGMSGIHIYVPLGALYSFDQALNFAKLIAYIANERSPALTSLERSPSKRSKKIYLDYLQNRFGQSVAAPYSVRPGPHAPVSTPLKWSEVKKGLDPMQFTIKTVIKRIHRLGDIFRGVLTEKTDLKKCLDKLDNI